MLKLSATRNLAVTVEPLGGVQGEALIGSDVDLPPVEVLHVILPATPSVSQIRDTHKWRKNNQNRSVVIAIQVDQKVTLFGPTEDRQPAEVSASTAQRVLQAALSDTSTITARKNLVSFYDTLGSTELSGIKNKGLFASHHLKENLPKRADWSALKEQGIALATKRKRSLIEALGFSVASEERNTLILKGSGKENRVVAVLLEDAENFDSPGGRFPSSPVSWGLSVAADNNVPWLIVLKKDQIRLHPGKDGVGVGQKGQAETFLELNLAQMDDSDLALLPLIFSATSLEADGEVQKILDDSSKYAVILGARLRERVYESVVPNISIAVAKKLQSQGRSLDAEGLQLAYSLTLRILFRLLFQAYAEDRGLLPAGRNEGYDANSLKTIAKREMKTKPEDFGEAKSIWYDLVQVWDAIDEGNARWQVPAYNGGLFGRDPSRHPEGALISGLELSDAVMGPALQALLVDKSPDGVLGPVDFRSLSVREFGTIYEGLLESSLSLAEIDLTVDASEAWVPAKNGQNVLAKAGDPYFHSASGERKATGSYFTPKFVVDHLVEKAIDPTIDQHLAKISAYLSAGDQATAGREFFDYRVADIAMGSAHFLVAAVDRIEAKMRAFLTNPATVIPGVIDELDRLRAAATSALGGEVDGDLIAIGEIEDASLLRRQIARRCVYGLDINPLAVELARLAIWIHTFVPGLPMSSLNHNLVCANSLTGMGSIDEAIEAILPGRRDRRTLFDSEIESNLEKAKQLLIESASASEATKAEVKHSEQLALEARSQSMIALDLFSVATAARAGVGAAKHLFTVGDLQAAGSEENVLRVVGQLKPGHFPYLFPEVFLKLNPGFDALIGNPPWEKIQIDRHRWWAMRRPGLVGMSQADRDAEISRLEREHPASADALVAEIEKTVSFRNAVMRGPFPGLGSGNVDLYQAFVWQNWRLLSSSGVMGIVVPRGALSGSALQVWRKEVIESGCFRSVTMCINTNGWLFNSVHSQYAIAFVVADRKKGTEIRFGGPVRSQTELENATFAKILVDEFESWSSSMSFPNINGIEDASVLRTVNRSPRLDHETGMWKVRATQGDMNATTDKSHFNVASLDKPGEVLVFGGGSFNIWDPGYGKPFATADRAEITSFLRRKFDRSCNNSRSAYFGISSSGGKAPFERARIAYRWITNATNSRTCIVALLPPGTALVNSAPTFAFHRGGAKAEAYLLGIMSSIPYDWTIRRWVEMNFTFEVLYPSRVPFDKIQTLRGERLIELSARLASVDERYADWALEVGVATGSVKTDRDKEAFITEIDALACLLFGLDMEQVNHIYATFHRGWDYKPRLEKVLEYYEQWKDVND